MATSYAEEKWEHSEDEDEAEEEALSLCDLPVNSEQEENDRNDEAETKEEEAETGNEEFNFGSWKGSFGMKSPEMCVADDIFYQGQILPLCVSFNLETPLIPNNSKHETFHSSVTCLSRSESLDHSGFTSFSSRSSSIGSSAQYSTSSNNTTPITTTRIITNKPRNIIQPQFQAYPSPKPQLKLSRPSMESNRTRKSSVWDFFRLGPVRTPNIELHDLKARSCVSRNSSCSNGKKKLKKQRLLSGCSCRVSDVKAVPMNKSFNRKQKEGGDGERKQAKSRHRTYEWIIKELSHARYGVDEDGGGQDS